MSKRRRIALIVVGGFVALVLLAWAVVGILFDGYRIPSFAMAPTLDAGDRVLARPTDGDNMSRGDIVVFTPDVAGVPPFPRISRVVAVAGDAVDDADGFLTVDGRRAREPYLEPGTQTDRVEPVEVPRGHVYVLGDNRPISQDSRFYGPVPVGRIHGRVVLQYWPLGELGGLD